MKYYELSWNPTKLPITSIFVKSYEFSWNHSNFYEIIGFIVKSYDFSWNLPTFRLRKSKNSKTFFIFAKPKTQKNHTFNSIFITIYKFTRQKKNQKLVPVPLHILLETRDRLKCARKHRGEREIEMYKKPNEQLRKEMETQISLITIEWENESVFVFSLVSVRK